MNTKQTEELVDHAFLGTVQEGAEAFDRNSNHARKAQAILRIAAEIFAEKGYKQTSVADIADRLNISKPTVYYYIGNKEEILFKCHLAAVEVVKEYIAKVAAQNLTGLEAFKQLMLLYAEWMESGVARCAARCQLDLLDPKAKAEILAQRGMADRVARDIIVRGISDGSIRPCNPQTAVAALFGAFSWMAYWYDPKRAPTRSTGDIGKEFIDLFVHGLKAKEVTSSQNRS